MHRVFLKKFSNIKEQMHRKFRSRTIARDLVLQLTFALSISAMFAGSVSFIYQTHTDRYELKGRVAASATSLASLLSLPVWTFNETEIKAVASSHSLDEAITGIKIVDDFGTTIVDSHKTKKNPDVRHTKNIFYRGKKIGKVTVSASTDALYVRAWRNLGTIMAMVCLAVVAIFLVILPLVERFLEVPLNKLVSGIQKIAGGQYKEALPPVPQRELAKITREVNYMAEKIATRERQIAQSMEAATILKTELGIAETLQRSMNATVGQGTADKIARYYQPMSNLSGDWLTVFDCDDGKTVYAMVGDVTGHGIPQGLVTMAAFGAVQTLTPLIRQDCKSFTPATILNILRDSLRTILRECDLAMTVSVIKINLVSREVLISNAGHPLPLVVRPGEGMSEVATIVALAQSPLGFEFLLKGEEHVAYEDASFALGSSDMICLFSDGLIEAQNKFNKAFSREFVKTLRKTYGDHSPSALMKKVIEKFNEHVDGGQVKDDICFMVIDTRLERDNEAVA